MDIPSAQVSKSGQRGSRHFSSRFPRFRVIPAERGEMLSQSTRLQAVLVSPRLRDALRRFPNKAYGMLAVRGVCSGPNRAG